MGWNLSENTIRRFKKCHSKIWFGLMLADSLWIISDHLPIDMLRSIRLLICVYLTHWIQTMVVFKNFETVSLFARNFWKAAFYLGYSKGFYSLISLRKTELPIRLSEYYHEHIWSVVSKVKLSASCGHQGFNASRLDNCDAECLVNCLNY